MRSTDTRTRAPRRRRQVVAVGDRLLGAAEELCLGNPMWVLEFLAQVKAADPPVLAYANVGFRDVDEEEGGGARQSVAEAAAPSLAQLSNHEQCLSVDLAEGIAAGNEVGTEFTPVPPPCAHGRVAGKRRWWHDEQWYEFIII